MREVRFTAAPGADGVATGGAYLSDLAFESSSVGTAAVTTWQVSPGAKVTFSIVAPARVVVDPRSETQPVTGTVAGPSR